MWYSVPCVCYRIFGFYKLCIHIDSLPVILMFVSYIGVVSHKCQYCGVDKYDYCKFESVFFLIWGNAYGVYFGICSSLNFWCLMFA